MTIGMACICLAAIYVIVTTFTEYYSPTLDAIAVWGFAYGGAAMFLYGLFTMHKM